MKRREVSIPAANTLMSHEVILVKIIVIIDRHRITTGDVAILEFLELHQVHRVAEQASDATESLHELAALWGFVRDELEGATKLLVALGKPLDHLV